MNYKKEIISILKGEVLKNIIIVDEGVAEPRLLHKHSMELHRLCKLITAAEQAIFQLPSEEEETEEFHKLLKEKATKEAAIIYAFGWQDSKNYFLNYNHENND